MGDVFVTESIAILMEMQNQRRDELYLFSEYDPQPYYPSLLSKDTFGKQILNQLYTALEEHNKLPAVILVILGNKQIDNMVMNPEQTRRIWSALFTEIQRTIRTRKEDLPRKCKSVDQPKVLITNLFPRFKDHNDKFDKSHESFKTKRRRLNGILPQIANGFGYTILPMTGILPDQTDFFSSSTGQLNSKGITEFWNIVSKAVKLDDIRCEEKYKNLIIQEHFDFQREQRKIAQERSKIRKDRFSMNRTKSLASLKGIARDNKKDRNVRSNSVPPNEKFDKRKNCNRDR